MTRNNATTVSWLPRWVALTACGLWLAVWAYGAISYLYFDKYEAPWLLAIFTAPTFTLINPLIVWAHKLSGDNGSAPAIIDFAGILLAGLLLYGVIGYLLGRAILLVRMQWKRDSERGIDEP